MTKGKFPHGKKSSNGKSSSKNRTQRINSNQTTIPKLKKIEKVESSHIKKVSQNLASKKGSTLASGLGKGTKSKVSSRAGGNSHELVDNNIRKFESQRSDSNLENLLSGAATKPLVVERLKAMNQKNDTNLVRAGMLPFSKAASSSDQGVKKKF